MSMGVPAHGLKDRIKDILMEQAVAWQMGCRQTGLLRTILPNPILFFWWGLQE
jgi:hypothetical protein